MDSEDAELEWPGPTLRLEPLFFPSVLHSPDSRGSPPPVQACHRRRGQAPPCRPGTRHAAASSGTVPLAAPISHCTAHRELVSIRAHSDGGSLAGATRVD